MGKFKKFHLTIRWNGRVTNSDIGIDYEDGESIMLKIESRFNFQELYDLCAERVCTSGQTRLGKITYRYPDMSAGGVVFQEVVINDDDAVMMMLQFLSDNQVRLAEVYVETEALGESHSHQYSYDDGFAGGYEWHGNKRFLKRIGKTSIN
ncbi:unnamed protein product [Linum trigynum]|uniref:Uncharacterized protein n=1 Tax=Linum trigynum TaxID=586398 RepID=A0AAV2ENW2_9ROSI